MSDPTIIDAQVSLLAASEPTQSRKPTKVGRYQILAKLGQGSNGTVYKARDLVIGRLVALKTLPLPSADAPPEQQLAVQRFIREARSAGGMAHPNVVVIHDVGRDEAEGVLYIAMQLVEGTSLQHELRQERNLSFETISSIGIQVADALQAAHRHRLIHRDIKPGNLMLGPTGHITVVDFGVAKLVDSKLTRDGTVLGSLGYMSPEQVSCSKVDARSDIFSLGTVLYELCTMRRAFPATDTAELLRQLLECQSVPLLLLRPDTPAYLADVISRAMSSRPQDRFQTATEMAEALSQPVLSAATPAAKSPKTAEAAAGSSTRAMMRKRSVLVAVAAISMWSLALLAGTSWRSTARKAAGGVEPTQDASIGLRRVETTGHAGNRQVTAPSLPSTLERSSRLNVAVTHDHFIGSCQGTLRVLYDRVEYSPARDDGHVQTWRLREVASVRSSGNDVRIEGIGRRRSNAPKDVTYTFRFANAAMAGQVAALVQRQRRAVLR